MLPGIALTLALLLVDGAARGEEQQGVIKSVDPGRRTTRLTDGTELWLVPGLSLDLFAQGKRVKVSMKSATARNGCGAWRPPTDGREAAGSRAPCSPAG